MFKKLTKVEDNLPIMINFKDVIMVEETLEGTTVVITAFDEIEVTESMNQIFGFFEEIKYYHN